MIATDSATVSDFHVPDDLAELDQSVLWRHEERGHKPTKVAYRVSGNRADSTDRRTWATFDDAVTPERKGWLPQPLPDGVIPYGQQYNTIVSLCGTLRRRRIRGEAILACLLIVSEKQRERPGPRGRTSRAWFGTQSSGGQIERT